MAARHFARPHVRAHSSRVLPFALIFSALLIGSWLVTSITASVAAVGTITVVKVPDGAAVGEPLAQQPVFNLTGSSSTTVTCSVSGGDGQAVLSGQTATVIGTTATFTNLTFTAGTVQEFYTLACQGSDTDVYTRTITMEALPGTLQVVQSTSSPAMRWVNGTVLAVNDNDTISVSQAEVESSANSAAAGGGVTLKSTVEIKVNGSITYTQARSLTFKTKKYTQGNGSSIDTKGGDFTIWSTNPSGGNQGAGTSPVSVVDFGTGTSVATGVGNISISGGPAGSTNPVYGDIPVRVYRSTLSTSNGNISIYAQVVPNNALTGEWNQVGLLIDGSTGSSSPIGITKSEIKSTGSGNITIDVVSDVGTGVTMSAGVLITTQNNSTALYGGYSTIDVMTGALNIKATPQGYTRPSANGDGTYSGNGTYSGSVSPVTFGVALSRNANNSNCSNCNQGILRSMSTGSITVLGVSGAATSTRAFGSMNAGVYLDRFASIKDNAASGGNVSVTGISGSNISAAATSYYGTHGVFNDGSLYSTGAGKLSVTGYGGDHGSNANAYQTSGVYISGSTYSENGDFTLSGTGGNYPSATATYSSSIGVYINTSSSVGSSDATKTGNLLVTGVGGHITGSGGTNKSYKSVGVSGSPTAGKGSLTITATGGNINNTATGTATQNSSIGWTMSGAQFGSSSTTNPVQVTGQGGWIQDASTTSATASKGVELLGGTSTTFPFAGAPITINGTSGAIRQTNASATKNVSSVGIDLNSSTYYWNLNSSSITLNGTAGVIGSATPWANVTNSVSATTGMFGVILQGSSRINTTNGNISINANGISNISATVNGQAVTANAPSVGYFQGTAGIYTTGSGNISISGDAKKTDRVNQAGYTLYGVYFNNKTSVLQASSSGSISVTGVGGTHTASSTTVTCVGANLGGSFTTSTGAITIAGTGCSAAATPSSGSNSNSFSHGIQMNSDLAFTTTGTTPGQGNITITGTSGSTSVPSGYWMVYGIAGGAHSSLAQTITTAAGEISITGSNDPSNGSASKNAGGISDFTPKVLSTGGANVTMTGTGRKVSGAAFTAFGVSLGSSQTPSANSYGLDSTGGTVTINATGVGNSSSGGLGLNLQSGAASATCTISSTSTPCAQIGATALAVVINASGANLGSSSPTTNGAGAGIKFSGWWTFGGASSVANFTINTNSVYGFKSAGANDQYPIAINTSGSFALQPLTGSNDFGTQWTNASTPVSTPTMVMDLQPTSRVSSLTIGKSTTTKSLTLMSAMTMGSGTFKFTGGAFTQTNAMQAAVLALQVSDSVVLNSPTNVFSVVAINSTQSTPAISFSNASTNWTATNASGVTAVYGIPTDLKVASQPTTGQAGTALTSLTVGSKDAYGYDVATANARANDIGAVTAALATSPTGSTLGGTTSATASSGVATFSSLTGDLAGDYTFTFSAAGYTSVTSSTITLTVAKVAQATLLLVTSSTTGPYNSTISLSTSGGSGTGAVSYALGGADSCTISGTTLTLASNAGTTCSVTATKATDAQYLVATSTAVSFTITKADQAALTVTSTSGAYNSVLSLTVSGGTTAGTVTYVKDSTGCSLTSSSLTLNSNAGTTCAVTATMAGNTNYNAVSSSSTTITISKANQAALTVTSTSGSYNSVLALTFSGGTTGGAVTFVKDSAGCALSGSDLTLSSNAGTTCAVTATMAGNTNYNAVSSSSTPISITRATQSAITVTSATNVVWGTNLTLTYSGGNSTSTAVWAATGTKCSVSGNVLSSTGGGDCVVSVTLPQDTNYTSATSADFTVTLDRKSQSILNWDSSVPSSIDYLSTATLAVTGGNGSGTVVYTKSNFSTCSVALNVVTAGDAGSVCRIIATKIGDDDYLSVDSAAKVFTINKISQTTLAFSNGNTFVYGQTLSLLANGGSGDGLIAYSVTTSANPNTAGCQITNGALTATSSGTCDVQAQRASSTNYLVSTATTQTITISTATQAISFTSTVPATPMAGGSYSITASASSGLTVVFTTNSSACSVSGTQVSFVTSGSCVVQAAQAGDSRYQSASPITQTIVIGSRNQTLTFTSATTNITSKAFGSPAFVISATSTEADAVVTYSLNSATSNSSCTVTSGGVVVVNFVGSCVIDANAAGTASYVAASTITHTVAIVPDLASAPFIMSTSAGNRAITASFLPPTYLGGSAISGYVLRAVDQANSSNVIAETGCSYSLVNGQATCTVNGLVNGVTYKVQVAAVTAGGVGEFSELSGSLVAATNPAAVQQLSVAESNNSLVISWDDPDNLGGGSFTEYRIFIKPSASANYDQVHYFTSSPMTTRSKTVSTVTPSGAALSNGTPYDVKIVTVTSANSTEMTANTSQVNKIPRTTPDAPVVVQPVLAGSQLLISWNVPVSDGGSAISSYGVVFNGLNITPSQPTATFVLLPAPSAGGTYPYQVFATNVAGPSAPATGVFTVALPPTPGAGGGSVSGGGSTNSDAVASAQQAARTPVAPTSASPTPVGADGFSAKPDAAAPQQNSASAPLNSNNEGSSTSAIDDFWMLLLIVLAALAAVITVAFIAVRITRGS